MSTPYLAVNRRGVWEIRWSEGGRSHRKSTREREQAAAVAAFGRWLAGDGLLPGAAPSADLRLEDVLEAYLTDHVAHRVIAQSRALIAAGWLREGLGGVRVSELTDARLLHYQAERRARDGVSDATLRRELGVLQAALNYAVAERRLAAAACPVVRLPPEGRPRQRWLTTAQVGQLARAIEARLAAEATDGTAWFAALALETGARKGAIEALTWELVDREAGLVWFSQVALPLSRVKRRVDVPISDRLEGWLARYRPGLDGQSRVVGTVQDLGRPFAALVAAAGLPGWVTPHVLRHTFATLRLRAGVPLWTVAGLLGDAPATVARVYGHHCQDALRAGVSRITLEAESASAGA